MHWTGRVTTAVAAVTLIAFAASLAEASDKRRRGWYVGGAVGVIAPADTTAPATRDDAANVNTPSSTVEFGTDAGFAVSAGYKFTRWFAAEGEIAHRTFDATGGTIGSNVATADGEMDLTHFTINAIFTQEFVSDGIRLYPYVGAGLGFANFDLKNIRLSSGANNTLVDTDGAELTYQLMLGLGYFMTDHISLDVSYRWQESWDPEITYGGVDTELVTGGYHSVLFGVKYHW